ncbi:MAG: asparaginase [Bdellovibrionales bacterium]|nr:asparaginase [Bdellovibrionales bacterium]
MTQRPSNLPRILILYTGGTIGMESLSSDVQLYRVAKKSPAKLKKQIQDRAPELAQIARCEVEVLMNQDSANMGPDDWVLIAERVQKAWQKYDGIVILHGTDSMAYTASALSYLLRPCVKPVILTGAQRPLAAIRTDARRNLISSVEIAARGPRSLLNQVCVFFDDRLFQGNRVRKRSAFDFQAYDSPFASALANVGSEIQYRREPREFKFASQTLAPQFDTRVLLTTVTPGFPSKAIRAVLGHEIQGLVLNVFASGTAPTEDPAFMDLLKFAKKKRVPVVAVTSGSVKVSMGQAMGSGRSLVDPRKYGPGRDLIKAGALWAGTMTPEAAWVKVSFLLGQRAGAERFSALWNLDLAGESS